MSARVIYLPALRCETCEHFEAQADDEGSVASFCRNWQEPIDDERVAHECPDYVRSQEER